MAESEEVKIVTVVDTDKAEDNIKTLSQRISEYRKVAQQAQSGTDEYTSAVLQLAQAKAQQAKIEADVRQAIKELTGATIQQTEATDQADQSVQSLSSQAKEYRSSLEQLTPGTEEYTQALGNYATVQTQINQINQDARAAVAALSGENQKAVNNIRELQKTVKQYKSDLAGLERGSEEYNQTLSKLATAQGQINQINKDVSASTQNLTDIYRNLSGVASGVVAGFQTLNAVSALLGIENEDLQKTFVKLQASMALIQSITALSNGFKSLTLLIPRARIAAVALNATLAANPILAVATLVAGLTAALITFIGASRESKKSVDDLKKSYKEFGDQLDTTTREYNHYISLLQAAGASEQQVLYTRAEANSKLGRDLRAEYAQITAGLKKETGEQREILEEQLKDLLKRIEAYNEENKSIREEIQRTQVDQAAKAYDDARKKFEEESKKAISDIKKRNKEIEDANLTSYEIRLRDLTDTYNKELATYKKFNQDTTLLTEQFEKDKIQLRQNADIQAAKIEQQRQADALASLEKTLDQQSEAINESYQSRINQISSDQEELQLRLIDIDSQIDLLRTEGEAKNRDAIAELEQQRLEAQMELFESQNLIDIANVERLEQYNVYLEEIKLNEELTALEIEEIERRLQDNLTELQQAGIAQRINQQEAYGKFEVAQAKQKKKLADDEEELRRKSLQQLATFLSASSSLVGQDTAAGKAFAVAGATINTYLAGTKTLEAYAGIPGPTKYIELGATIASGLATVKNILKTNIPGQADTATTTAAAVPVMPEIQQQATPVFDQQDAYREFDVEDNRAVLVVEDYENVRNDVYVAENESILR